MPSSNGDSDEAPAVSNSGPDSQSHDRVRFNEHAGSEPGRGVGRTRPGRLFYDDAELVFVPGRLGYLRRLFGGMADAFLGFLPSQYGWFDPYAVSRAEAPLDRTRVVPYRDVTGVTPVAQPSGTAVFVRVAGSDGRVTHLRFGVPGDDPGGAARIAKRIRGRVDGAGGRSASYDPGGRARRLDADAWE